MYRIGLELGDSFTAVGLVGEDGVLTAKSGTPTRRALGADGILGDAAQCIENTLLLSGVDKADCAGIGVVGADAVPELGGVSTADWLRARTGLKTLVGTAADGGDAVLTAAALITL